MNSALSRPDGEGKYASEGITLGYRHLCFIDLSNEGHQSMSNEDGTLVLVFNGAYGISNL
jgi:asparagine synthase (glutamine-hydrolysing)